jgi:hypothetical protein
LTLVNPVLLVVGIGAYVAFFAWTMSDWRVRSARSAALFVLALIAAIVARVNVSGPAGWVIAAVLGLLIVTPVLLVHPAVMPLGADDAGISRSLDEIQRRLIRAGRRFKSVEMTLNAYVDELKAARELLRDARAPDREWGALLAEIDEELSSTIANAEGMAKYPDQRERRTAIRRHHNALVRKRLRFWR